MIRRVARSLALVLRRLGRAGAGRRECQGGEAHPLAALPRTARSPSATSATSGRPARTARTSHRLTVHKARDVYPRFSPDGKWIAFSSDREGSLDVYLIPSRRRRRSSGSPIHSADDTVLGWTPDGKSVLFASQRGEDFMGKLYTVPVDGGMARERRPRHGRRRQLLARRHEAGHQPQGPVVLAEVLPRRLPERRDRDGPRREDLQGPDRLRRHGLLADVEPGRLHLLRLRPRRQRPRPTSGASPRAAARPSRSPTSRTATSASRRSRSDGKTIVFERDFGIWKLDLASQAGRARSSSTSPPRPRRA